MEDRSGRWVDGGQVCGWMDVRSEGGWRRRHVQIPGNMGR